MPDAFPPRSDTRLLLQNMHVPPGVSVLDVGTGMGVLAVVACKAGAERCVALDINPQSVRNAKSNTERHQLNGRLDIRLSDGLAALAPGERFDLVLANLPGWAAPASDHVEAAQWDTGFATNRAFFAKVRKYLSPNGHILMAKANYPGINDVPAMAEENGLMARIVAAQAPKEDDPRRYVILVFAQAQRRDQWILAYGACRVAPVG
ncbi:tRNA (adenine(22)-N(1))-methyltransferase TrmK [uncultured Roseobacter sp.]|uniref:tRNA (adenine(22)-N(1))-methyltransferase TrmK n=1 Tax=uncultured Roseobacter sp. TaxID=114847 RepID=UPI00260C9BB2|nr:tRNA (adenine(22)-N(1))-methyltransferase TrmK [uncultured Roseobacter sp.]